MKSSLAMANPIMEHKWKKEMKQYMQYDPIKKKKKSDPHTKKSPEGRGKKNQNINSI